MMVKHLRSFLAVVLVAILATPAIAGTRQGDRYWEQGRAAEAVEDWETAVSLYTQATEEDPRDANYIIGLRRARFNGAQEHVRTGRDLRSAGNITEAMAEFQRAILMDPSLAIALEELKRTQQMIDEPVADPDLANLTPAERQERAEVERMASMLNMPVLNPPVHRIPALMMNNQPMRILYDTVAKIAGVTVVWDSTWNVPNDTFDVNLPESSVEEAFAYLAQITRTFWKPLTDTTIFVTEESANKRRDFEDNIVKTFFVTNATTVQEFQEITTAVRTITDIRRAYSYNALKALVVRGPADAVDLAEKLIRDLDKPKSEVLIDVIVLEANSAYSRDLAASLAGGAGLNIPVNFAPRDAITNGNGNVPLPRLGNLSSGDFTTTLPGALLQAIMSDTKTRLINSPQVRTSDGQQVTLNIGDRVPIATGSFQSGVGGGVGAVGVNTQFQFIDVGVNVSLTPQVHSATEVTLHVEVEVSNVRNFVDLGNIMQPVIRQNKGIADLRLRDGEVNILSGLSQQQDSETISGIPGLVNIPILGKWLFGSQNVVRDRGELMIALVPHIIRTPNFTQENLRGIYAGSDTQLMLRRAPRFEDEEPGIATELEGDEAFTVGADGELVPPVTAPPATAPPATAPPATAPQAIAPPGVGQPPATAPPPIAAAPANPGQARLTFLPGVVTVPANSPFTVNVQMENATDLYSLMPLRISWDPAMLRLNDIAPGELLSRDGGRVTSVKDIRNDTGQATLSVTRPPGQPGISGSGPVATLTFVSIGSGSGSVTVTELAASNGQGQAIPVTLGAVPVAVQ